MFVSFSSEYKTWILLGYILIIEEGTDDHRWYKNEYKTILSDFREYEELLSDGNTVLYT